MPAHDAWLACFDGCPGRIPALSVNYTCPQCGGLLEVVHDEELLARTSAAEWRERFDARLGKAVATAGGDAAGGTVVGFDFVTVVALFALGHNAIAAQ